MGNRIFPTVGGTNSVRDTKCLGFYLKKKKKPKQDQIGIPEGPFPPLLSNSTSLMWWNQASIITSKACLPHFFIPRWKVGSTKCRTIGHSPGPPPALVQGLHLHPLPRALQKPSASLAASSTRDFCILIFSWYWHPHFRCICPGDQGGSGSSSAHSAPSWNRCL